MSMARFRVHMVVNEDAVLRSDRGRLEKGVRCVCGHPALRHDPQDGLRCYAVVGLEYCECIVLVRAA